MLDDEAKPNVRLFFSDLLGLAHGKVVPRGRLTDTSHHCMTLMAQALDGRDDIVNGYGLDVGSPDIEALVDLDTEMCGWQPDTSVAMASLYHAAGEPRRFELDPRGALERAVSLWRDIGMDPILGFEMEFYLLRGRPDQTVEPLATPAHRPYGTGIGGDPSGLGQRIFNAAIEAGFDVTHLSTEFDPGQLEVVLNHGTASRSADFAFLFRELAREVAAAQGAWCTFLGKPITGKAGNGLHLNFSVKDVMSNNGFDDSSGNYGLARVAQRAVAGILRHYPALCAIAAPTVNAYKRLQPGAIGAAADWGLEHRLAAIRVPNDRGDATRLEFRVADGSASPHLLSAAVLFAAYLGVQDELELAAPRCGAASNADIFSPNCLADALAQLEQDDQLVALLGPDLVRTFIGLKRWEWRQWSSVVTDWEVQYYGSHY